MNRRVFLSVGLVFIAVAGVLLGLMYVSFGTRIGWETQFRVFWYVISALLVLLLLSLWVLEWPHRLAAMGVMAGLVLFGVGLYGDTGFFCIDLGVPPGPEYGVTYDWWTNSLEFGVTDGDLYWCEMTPARGWLLSGYLLVCVGLSKIVTDHLNNHGLLSADDS